MKESPLAKYVNVTANFIAVSIAVRHSVFILQIYRVIQKEVYTFKNLFYKYY
jgi:hypothetical protein